MKLKNILLLGLFILFVGSFHSCKEDSKPKLEKVDLNGKEYTSKYICPMYCKTSGSEEMGICPVCKMDYELNEKYKEE